ncbi:hypothetical protein AAG570_004547 [Ranatra chinensis]|uniref:SUN domain-containing protein n=1 Tax=Ranatra chinensis TaxID=642074 RepID=A0ABD0Y3H0_9HEMI
MKLTKAGCKMKCSPSPESRANRKVLLCDEYPQENQIEGMGDPYTGGSYILEKLYGDQADYALEKNGGNVYSILGTQAYAPNPVAISIYGITLWNHISNNPLTVIKTIVFYKLQAEVPGVARSLRKVNRRSLGGWEIISSKPQVVNVTSLNWGMITPGECWAFRGSGGSIVLQLAKSAIITSVAVEHIPKSLTITGNTDSAPKEFSVCAYVTEDYFPDKCLHLGDFEFNRDGPPRQQFYTELKKKPDGTAMSFRFIQFDFMTNYGNEQYTCIYRLRVYANQGT